MDKFYTCEDIAARYGVPLATVWRWVRSGKLPAIRPGKEYRIRETDLLDFEDASSNTKGKA